MNTTLSWTRLFLCLSLISIAFFQPANAQLIDSQAGLTPVGDASLGWADYDLDGDPDLIVSGHTGSGPLTTLYQNTNGNFSPVSSVPFINVSLGEVVWGDYDQDGDPDLLLTGEMANGVATTQMYRNNGNGTFTDLNAGVIAVEESMAAWGDYDGDGDLDFFIAGARRNGVSITSIYRNNGNDTFTDIKAGLVGLRRGDGQWVDYDNDGDQDLVLTGRQTDNTRRTIIYQNTNGSFSDIGANLPDVDLSGIDWADINGNGYKELLMAGTSNSGIIAHVYSNPLETGNGFELRASTDGVEFASVQWVGFERDGLQATIMGRNANNVTHTRLYDGGSLSEIPFGVQGLFKGSVDWADFDQDGDPDLAIAGFDASDAPYALIYENTGATDTNNPPQPTQNLYAQVFGGSGVGLVNVRLLWTQALDENVPAFNATYNVRIGTTPGGSDILAPTPSGPGNNGSGLERVMPDLVQSPGTYYWSVQTVDEQFARSAFAPEQAFEVGNVQFGLVFPNLRADAEHVAWGDLDNDGDLDIILVGSQDADNSGTTLLSINENTNGQFEQRESDVTPLASGNVQLADYDNDNDLDILLQGDADTNDAVNQFVKLYRNDGNFVFTASQVSFEEFIAFCADNERRWMDADNNGSMDVFSPALTFDNGFQNFGVRLNEGGIFDDFAENWSGGAVCGVGTPGDLNNDGRTDIVAAGLETLAFRAGNVALHQNEGDRFGFEATDFKGWSGTPAVGDYDSDGDLDIVTAGAVYDGVFIPPGPLADFSGVYRNDLQGSDIKDEQFSLTAQMLPIGVGRPSWGDYDMDGDLDLLLPNTTSSPIWENRGGTFVNVLGVFTNSSGGFERIDVDHAVWGDYDGDSDLDILVSGLEDGRPVTYIFKNNIGAENDKPYTPNNLSAAVSASSVTFNWGTGGDEESLSPALTYNLRVGTTPGGSDILSAASLSDGTPLFVGYGNTFHNTSWTLNDLDEATYYWSVQSIDTGFRGSAFAEEQSVTVGAPDPGLTELTFELTGASIDPVSEAAAEWGDYNQDGLPDLIVTGRAGNGPSTRLYVSTGFGDYLVDSGIDFKDVDTGDVGWADYDGDGDLDLLISGRGSDWSFNTLLYRNTGSGFELVSTGLPGLFEGAIAWGDYDNDGDPDLLLTGMNSSIQNTAGIYRNDNGTFTDIGANLTGIRRGDIAWVDYDVDGDLDVLLTGRIDNVINRAAILYENNGGTFTEISQGIADVDLSSVDVDDYNDDGIPDFLITGTTGSEKIARVYVNTITGTTFFNVGDTGVEFSDAEWGDYDLDGDLDILLCGSTGGNRITKVFQNDDGDYTEASTFSGVSKCAATWADVNDDGYLDAFVSGEVSGSSNQASFYLLVPTLSSAEDAHGVSEREDLDESPEAFTLLSNYPNPFNPSTRITYNLPEASDVRLTVYDMTGKQVAVLAEGFRDAGVYEVNFDASRLASGMYLSRLVTASEVVVVKMVYLK